MVLPMDTIEDSKNDEVGCKLLEVQKHNEWTKEKRSAMVDLVHLLKDKGYIEFGADAKQYASIRVGESFLYNVPENKTGYLMPFRGQLVRIVCVGSGSYQRRSFMVGKIDACDHKVKG
ncbi:MAG: hypothetical protein AB7V04_06295 [Desulfomonilaceae bacterium]